MKAPAPRPPKVIQDGEKILSKYNAIVYIHQEKAWKPVYDKYAAIICSDLGAEDLNERYCISAFVGQEKMLQYNITLSTKVKIKDSFVRVQNEKMIVGARFKTNEGAEKYHQQLLGILSEISPYAKVVKKQKESVTSIGSTHEKHVRRDTAPDSSLPRKESVPKFNSLKRASVPTGPTAFFTNRETDVPKKDSVRSIKSIKGEVVSTPIMEKKELDRSNIEHPIWRAFLDLANLHSEELSNAHILSIVKDFVKEQGGDLFLRQVADQKLSARLVDDLNNLAGQIHAISDQPYDSPTLAKPQDDAMKQPQYTTAVSVDSATLDRKSAKSKRRAPAPPSDIRRSKSLENVLEHDSGRSKSLENVLENDSLYTEIGQFIKRDAFENNNTLVAKTVLTSPTGKRKAPGIPTGKSPVVSLRRKHFSNEDKPLPFFIPPPPPAEPPPQEVFGSPVGPLSPEVTGSPLRLPSPEVTGQHSQEPTSNDTDDVFEKNTLKVDLTEEHEAVAQLDMAICAGESDVGEKARENITQGNEPGTPVKTRDTNLSSVSKKLMEVDNDTSKASGESSVNVAPSDDVGKVAEVTMPQGENALQQQMQQQLLLLQEQVLQQQQLLLAAGIIGGKVDAIKPQEKPPAVITPSECIETETHVKTKIEVKHISDENVKLNAVVLPPETTTEAIKHVDLKVETQKSMQDSKTELFKEKPSARPIENINNNRNHSQSVENEFNKDNNSQPIKKLIEVVLEELPPPPSDFLDTTINSPALLPADNKNIESINKGLGSSTKKVVEHVSVCDNTPINHSSAPPKEVASITLEPTKDVVVDCKNSEPKRITNKYDDSFTRQYSLPEPLTKLPISSTMQPGLPKKPMSGLYAKLKQKTAAKSTAKSTKEVVSADRIRSDSVEREYTKITSLTPKIQRQPSIDMEESTTRVSNISNVIKPPEYKDLSTKCSNGVVKSNYVHENIETCMGSSVKSSPHCEGGDNIKESVANNTKPIQTIERNQNVLTDVAPCKTSSTEPKNIPVSMHEIPPKIPPAAPEIILKEDTVIDTVPPVQKTLYMNSNLNEVQNKAYQKIKFDNVELKKETVSHTSTNHTTAGLQNGNVLDTKTLPSTIGESSSVPSVDCTETNNNSNAVITTPTEIKSNSTFAFVSKEEEEAYINIMKQIVDNKDTIPSPSSTNSEGLKHENEVTQTSDVIGHRNIEDSSAQSVESTSLKKSEELRVSSEVDVAAPPFISKREGESITNDICVVDAETNTNGECPGCLNEMLTNSDKYLNSDKTEILSEVVTSSQSNIQNENHIDSTPKVSTLQNTSKNETNTATTQPTLMEGNKEALPVAVDNSRHFSERIVGNNFESPKDRMMRNIQERGTPVDYQHKVNQHSDTSQQVNKPSEVINSRTTPPLGHDAPLLKTVSLEKEYDSSSSDSSSSLKPNQTKIKPIVKPKPKPKPVTNNNNVTETKRMTFMRTVSEQPGMRKTTNLKSFGSLNIGFARDTELMKSGGIPTVGSIFSKKEPPKTLPKSKFLYRNATIDYTGSGKVSNNLNQAAKNRLQSSSSIDVVDLRSNTLRSEDPC